jgi:lysozyme
MIIDLSSNNGHPIDYAAAKAAGVQAAIIKATDGATYVNPFYARDVSGFESVGVPVIAYHYAEFGNVAAEAAHFKAVAGVRARVLDSETSTNAAWQQEFLNELNLASDQEMDYGSASTLPRGVRALLWPASYGKNYGFGDAWQYTDAAVINGIPGKVDASTWIGSLADFYALFSVDAPAPAPAPTPVPAPPPPTNYPEDHMESYNENVLIGTEGGWIASPVPTAAIVNVVVLDDNPNAHGGAFGVVPQFDSIATETGPQSPNGSINFTGGTVGHVYGVVIWVATA